MTAILNTDTFPWSFGNMNSKFCFFQSCGVLKVKWHCKSDSDSITSLLKLMIFFAAVLTKDIKPVVVEVTETRGEAMEM